MSGMDRFYKRKKEKQSNSVVSSASGGMDRYNKNQYYRSLDTSGVNDDYINTFASDANSFFSGVGDGNVSYTDATSILSDLNTRYDIVNAWLYQNKSKLSGDSYKGFSESLNAFKSGLDSVKGFYSKFESEEDYNNYTMGWLSDEAEYNVDVTARRQDKYQDNIARIEEINHVLSPMASDDDAKWWEKLLGLGGQDTTRRSYSQYYVKDGHIVRNDLSKDDHEALITERDALIAENNLYERLQKVLDDHYNTTLAPDFAQGAANRNFINATKEDLWNYDVATIEGSTALSNGGYFDEQGNIRNSKGVIVQYANSPVIEDKLGLFLGTSDEEITEAYNRLSLTNGNYTDTWANLMQEGDVNGWKYLKKEEIDTYYYYLNTQGQEAAYKYLDDMTTVLTRRATQEFTDYVNNAGILEQIGLNIASVPMNVFGGVAGFVDDVSNIVQGKEIDPYSRAHIFSNAASDIREKTAADIENLTKGFSLPLINYTLGDAYQAVMSGVDSLLGAAIGSGTYGVLMGTGAASSTMKELYDRGANTDQIIILGAIAGAAEGFFEKYSIEQLVSMDTPKTFKQLFINSMKQGGVEASEEALTEMANLMADAIFMGTQSKWHNSGENFGERLVAAAQSIAQAGMSGFISGAANGGLFSAVQKSAYNKQVKEYGQSIIDKGGVGDLQASASEMADNKAVTKLANKVAKKVTAKNVGKLAATIQDVTNSKDRSAIVSDLENKGLSKKEATKVADFVMKTAQGYEASATEVAEIEKITDKLPDETETVDEAAEYSKLLKETEAQTEAVTPAQAPAQATTPTTEQATKLAAQSPDLSSAEAVNVEQSAQSADVATADSADSAKAIPVTENATVKETATEGRISAPASVATTEEGPVTLESASKKYGAQAGAMISTYTEGQDVAKYDAAYSAAYNMGKSGVNLTYAMNSEATAYLSESQRELAHAAGADASAAEARAQDAANKAKANGKTGRRKGVVRGDGVSIADIKATFNDTQNTAYKLLTTYAEATGVDIVLYKSSANAKGEFEGGQGKFKWSEDTIYIDLNAGLAHIKDVNRLAKYTMLRTFAHEFTHFIEKWNPIWYNEFRKVVFDTLTERGENVGVLITAKMNQTEGMSYDKASREVVAEAMTDILPDANFVTELATKHRNIFQKLFDMLKDFLADLKAYFTSIGNNPSREAKALQEQVGEGVKYVENIVKLFDKIAVEAVENYQATVAVEEAAETKTNTEKKTEPKTDQTTKKTATETLREMGGKAVSDNMTDVTDLFFPELAKKEAPQAKKGKIKRAKKSDWPATDVQWTLPGDIKNPIAYSTVATSDLIDALADDNPTATIKELRDKINYDEDAKKVLQQYIDAGYGDQIANEWFSDNKKRGASQPTTKWTSGVVENTEANTNVENVDNREAVRQSVSDRQEDPRVLEGLQTEDVQGDVQRGDAVEGSVERGQQTVRDDVQSDAAGIGGRSGLGDRQSRDLRRNDELTPEAEKLHEEVSEQISQQSTEQPKGRNFVIGESLELPNGEKSRYKANVEAIRLVKQLEADGRYATEAEQAILSKYVGWGGLANAFDQRKTEWAKEYEELKELLTEEEYASARGSTLNAHFTDISVIKAMYDGLAGLGFNGGRMLEPSSGVGNFVGAMPADMSAKVKSWTMVELDGITGLMAKYLYPNADVRIQGFEKANIPDNFMDVIISNVPFGNYPITDKAYPKKVTSAIHNYFFAKSLDKVRPGGIVMFITSSYTMNAKDNTVRRYIMQRADLLGAIRLPDSAFKGNAGTEVVTDILVLKKRAANTLYAGEDFLEAPYKYINGYNGAFINSYFDAHPEMVLGTASFDGGMYRGNSLTYKALEGRGSLADQIREAFSHIKGKMDYPATLSREKTNFAVERANKKTKENGLVVRDGKVYQNKGGELVEVNKANGAAERISSMLEIRDAARNLMNYQQQGLNDAEIKKARAQLNKAYDAFVKKYGFINTSTNKNAIKDDPDCFSLFALENWNPDTKKATKADIFTKNTIAPNRTVTAAKDVSEGLIVSVNQTGGVDTELIARLTGKAEADVTRELIDSRKAFKNRNGELETAEVYLSGNVRAKLRDAEALVSLDADYQNNVEALKSVMPEDVGYQDIFVNPGTPWIPSSVYSDFAAYMLGSRNSEWRQAVDVTRNAETGNFTVELKDRYLKTNSSNTQKWGTPRRTFLELFDAMLNSKSVVIKDKLDDGSFVVNKDATAAANEKIENIQKEFQEWLWKDEARRGELETLYNEVFNSVVTPKYNGDNLTVNGANALKPLRPHQRNAVQRVISSGGNTLLAHKVGAGKTYEMAAAAMKLKELGLVKKPMFAVPKSLVAQWGNEFIDFFPTAKLLVAEASDFTASNRKVFMNRIANGEYDAVIVSYEQFEKLPMSDDFTRQLYQEQIDSVIAAIEEAKADKGAKALSVKDLEKKRKSLQAKIDKLTDKAKDEDNIDFEALGVDSLFVDEAHNFKNLFYTTSMTNVAGLGNKDGSKRAFDLYTKVRYLQQLNGGRGIVFATATPVMNSMSEMYIMQKYLQPDLLNQLGLSTFDAWAKQFGEVVNGVEIKPSGQGYRVKQSFSRFKNMSELQLLFRNFADVLTDIPGLKIPKMKGGKVNVIVCEPGQFQQDYMKELEKRADNIKNVDPSEDNMLKITSDGRKISYTQRMIDPSLPYEEGCKIFRCADNIIKEYNDSNGVKGTQIVFLDMATPKGKSDNTTETDDLEMDVENAQLYDDLKARLRQGGLPAQEIAFIHDADTDQKKKKLFADVNDGKVRVLIGSTGKMGVGMNAQKRIVAIHHLDAPWRPGDVEQRDGRAFRQGNINDEVSKYTYVTEGSFDARLWDILDRKQNFINQVMNGESVGRETEDTGEVTLSAAEVKALASGSPMIMEQVELDTAIKKLESLYRAHISAVRSAKERLSRDKGEIAKLEKHIANGKADIVARKDTYSDEKFSIKIGKSNFTDKKEAGIALMAEATAKATPTGYTTIGSFAGFELRVIKTSEGINGTIVGKQGYPFKTYPTNTTFMINHLIATVESIDEKVKLWEHNLAETQKDIAEQEKLIAEPFAKQAELDQKRARYNEVMEILNPKEEQSLDSVAEDTVQEQSRAYLTDDYPTEGVHWGIKAGIMTDADARIVWEAIANIAKRGYNSYQKTINGEYFVEGDDVLMVVDVNYRNPTVKTIYKFKDNESYAKEIIINARGIEQEIREAKSLIEIVYGEGYVEQYDFSARRANERENGRGKGDYSGTDPEGEIQYQQRTNTLTDREILQLAADNLEATDMSEAERDALQIFKDRLTKLENLQDERVEQGRLYKEQQFQPPVDRKAAEVTLNRIAVLDEQIKKAEADVLSLEDKKVFGDVLKKAKKVVEIEQKKHDTEIFKRHIDRMKNAADIKKYRERIKADVNELTNWVLKPNNKDIAKHIPDVLKNSVIPFLSSIDFTSKQQLRGGEATKADAEFVKRLNALSEALKENIDADGLYSGYNDSPTFDTRGIAFYFRNRRKEG